jgi:hypothetical protein
MRAGRDHPGDTFIQGYRLSFVREVGGAVKENIPAILRNQISLADGEDNGRVQMLSNGFELCFRANSQTINERLSLAEVYYPLTIAVTPLLGSNCFKSTCIWARRGVASRSRKSDSFI